MINRSLIHSLKERRLGEGPSEGGFSMNVANVPAQQALSYANDIFQKKMKQGVTEIIPDFKKNYATLQRAMKKAKAIPRSNMPVIEPEDIDDFMRDLTQGRVDLFAPYVTGSMFRPPERQHPLSGEEAAIVLGGLDDGDQEDDKVAARLGRTRAGALLPIQNQVWLEKLIMNTAKFGPPSQGSPVTEATLIISSDNYIIDGHHRWGQAVLADPSLKMSTLRVPFPVEELLGIARAYGGTRGRSYKESSLRL